MQKVYRRLTEQPVTGNCKLVEALHLLQRDLHISSSFHNGLKANLTLVFHHLSVLHFVLQISLSLPHSLPALLCLAFYFTFLFSPPSLTHSCSYSCSLSFSLTVFLFRHLIHTWTHPHIQQRCERWDSCPSLFEAAGTVRRQLNQTSDTFFKYMMIHTHSSMRKLFYVIGIICIQYLYAGWNIPNH